MWEKVTLNGSLNFIFRIFFAAVAMFYSIQCIIKYLDREIGTRVNYVPTSKIVFPDVTLCWKLGYKKNVLREFGFVKGPIIFENLTDIQHFMNVSRFDMQEFVMNLTVNTLTKVENSYVTTLWTSSEGLNGTILKWRPAALQVEGLCYTTTFPEKFASAGINNMQIIFYSDNNYFMEQGIDFRSHGWKVILHRKGQFYRSSSIAIGTKTKYSTKVSVDHSLFQKINDSKDCDFQMNEGYDSCWHRTVSAKILNSIRRLFPWNKNELKESDKGLLCHEESDFKSNAEENAKAEMLDSQTNNCTAPCEILTFSSTPPLESILMTPSGQRATDYGELLIDFKEDVLLIQEFFVYDGLSMVGEAGGYLGLFLGVSCYQILIIVMNFASEREHKISKILRRKETEKPK